jgi:hypothetical protein
VIIPFSSTTQILLFTLHWVFLALSLLLFLLALFQLLETSRKILGKNQED